MAKRRSRAPFALGLDPAAYNPTGLRAYGAAELIREHSRLREEAQDRLRKLGRSEFSDTTAYTQNVGRWKTLEALGIDRKTRAMEGGDLEQAVKGSRRALERQIIEMERFVMSKRSSASGQREIRRETISTLKAHGYTWVNTKNYKDFVEFMEELRAKGGTEQYYRSYLTTELDADELDAEELRERREERSTQRRAFETWRAERNAERQAPNKRRGSGNRGRR